MVCEYYAGVCGDLAEGGWEGEWGVGSGACEEIDGRDDCFCVRLLRWWGLVVGLAVGLQDGEGEAVGFAHCW